MRTIIFDLDGTVTDPAAGITGSINHALVKLGHPEIPLAALEKYIGPPLESAFAELLGITDDDVLAEAVALYRERFMSVGYRENLVYEGMKEILEQISEDGSALYIATAKRQDIAVQVLQHLGLEKWFSQVHGCDLGRSKADLLRDILSDDRPTGMPAVMIGDRVTDFEAAAEVGMPSIGVRWGYGSEEELASATEVASVPDDLPAAIARTARSVNEAV